VLYKYTVETWFVGRFQPFYRPRRPLGKFASMLIVLYNYSAYAWICISTDVLQHIAMFIKLDNNDGYCTRKIYTHSYGHLKFNWGITHYIFIIIIIMFKKAGLGELPVP
jgi:hypothetical protein